MNSSHKHTERFEEKKKELCQKRSSLYNIGLTALQTVSLYRSVQTIISKLCTVCFYQHKSCNTRTYRYTAGGSSHVHVHLFECASVAADMKASRLQCAGVGRWMQLASEPVPLKDTAGTPTNCAGVVVVERFLSPYPPLQPPVPPPSISHSPSLSFSLNCQLPILMAWTQTSSFALCLLSLALSPSFSPLFLFNSLE